MNIKKSVLGFRRRLIGTIRKYFLFYFLNHGNRVGKGFYCGKHCSVSRKNTIEIGNGFYMGRNSHLGANLVIGDNVLFASYVAVVGGDHKIDYIDTPINKSGRDELKTTLIEDNVWIGHGAIILQGVKIGTGAVVASGAVVTKSIPENAVFGGNPAKEIRIRKFN